MWIIGWVLEVMMKDKRVVCGVVLLILATTLSTALAQSTAIEWYNKGVDLPTVPGTKRQSKRSIMR